MNPAVAHRPLTERQKDTLDALRVYIERQGHAPSLAKLGALLGVAPPVANNHVVALERRGLLRRVAGVHHGIELVAAPAPEARPVTVGHVIPRQRCLECGAVSFGVSVCPMCKEPVPS